jgi:hypothetical protein
VEHLVRLLAPLVCLALQLAELKTLNPVVVCSARLKHLRNHRSALLLHSERPLRSVLRLHLVVRLLLEEARRLLAQHRVSFRKFTRF